MVRVGETEIAPPMVGAVGDDPAVRSVELTGSRARGEAGPLSDWDFQIETSDFEAVAEALPELVAPLEPLAQQWDRLSARACYMLLLRGIGKVDLIFDEPWESSPPWHVSTDTLSGIDDHFWDWAIWLAAKDQAGKRKLVQLELGKMQEHLLGPLGVERVPDSVQKATVVYRTARAQAERRLNTYAPRELEDEVVRLLREAGYDI